VRRANAAELQPADQAHLRRPAGTEAREASHHRRPAQGGTSRGQGRVEAEAAALLALRHDHAGRCGSTAQAGRASTAATGAGRRRFGRIPKPLRAAFGLGLSEYGFRNGATWEATGMRLPLSQRMRDPRTAVVAQRSVTHGRQDCGTECRECQRSHIPPHAAASLLFVW
jgi:hypothetical protein